MKLIKLLSMVFLVIMSVQANAAQTTNADTKKTISVKAQEVEVVNINSADLATLQSLQGIGPQKAQAIIDYRKEHGNFKSIDDLSKVKGFNEKLVTKLIKQNPDKMVVKSKA